MRGQRTIAQNQRLPLAHFRADDARRANQSVIEIPVQPCWQKYLAFAVGQIKSSTVAVSSHRGALAIVTTAGRDVVDARARSTMRCFSRRRSRVVLTPRRWRQVGGATPPMTVTTKPVTEESTKETVKTIAQGMPGVSGEPVVTMLVCFLFLHARLRVQRAPGFPCAL